MEGEAFPATFGLLDALFAENPLCTAVRSGFLDKLTPPSRREGGVIKNLIGDRYKAPIRLLCSETNQHRHTVNQCRKLRSTSGLIGPHHIISKSSENTVMTKHLEGVIGLLAHLVGICKHYRSL